MTGLEHLNFVVSLVDRVSGPAAGMLKTMDRVTTNVQRGYQKIGYGTAGLVGAGFALDRLLTPAKELNRALGEVGSLQVADGVLQDLTARALAFSTAYGGSASDFVRSSYDIQSAISGLVGGELGQFTEASAILAKGTKADTATVTNYVGTMYGIFKQNADAMGKGRWVEQLAGQTAAAVQMFKTTGAEMSGAFGNLGAEATSHGVAMNEQMAILGTLQATMSGTEAGTKYKSFLAGVGKAQQTLGLQFTDSQGRMLPIVDILQRIEGRFGAIDTVAEADLLQKAFGRKEAVALIKLLSADIDGLSGSIAAIGEQTGMDKAVQMANAIKDPFEAAGAGVEAMQIALGRVMIPTLLPFLNLVTDSATQVLRWSELFPNLSRWLGITALAVMGLVAGVSLLSIGVGLFSFLSTGWAIALGAVKLALFALALPLSGAVAGVWALTTAMLANPVGLIVAGVVALGAAVYLAVTNWDLFKTGLLQVAAVWWDLATSFTVIGPIVALWERLPKWWLGFKNWLAGLNLFEVLGDGLNWLIDKINLLPGINIDTGGPPAPVSAPGAGTAVPAAGGVVNQFAQANHQSNRSVGAVTVQNFGAPMDGQTLADELAFAAG